MAGQTEIERQTRPGYFLFYKEETFFISGPQDRKVDRSTLASVFIFRSHIESKIDLCYMLLKTFNSKKERVSS